MTAGLTEAPCDSKHKDRIPLSKFPEITSIPDQAAAMTAGTGKQGYIHGMNGIIVKILRNRVEVFRFNGYHSSVWRIAMQMLGKQGFNFGW